MQRRRFIAWLLLTPVAVAACGSQSQAGTSSTGTGTAAKTTTSVTTRAQSAATPSQTVAPTSAPTATGAPSATATATQPAEPATTSADTLTASTATPFASADGPAARLAYLHEGTVYAVETPSGTPVPLGTDGVSGSLHWTRDGNTLFFSTGTVTPQTTYGTGTWPPSPSFPEHIQTWRWQPGGKPTKVQNGLWSPDGSAVAITQPPTNDTHATAVWMERDGKQQQITPNEPAVLWQARAWSPDGKRLALARYTTTSGPHGTLPNTATLWVTDDSLTRRTQLPLPNPNGTMNSWPDIVQWSPDGQWLLLGVGPGQGCSSCRADGLPFYALPADGLTAVGMGDALQDGALSWAPSGQWLSLSQGPKLQLGRETYVEKRLSRFDWPSAQHTDITSDPAWSDVEPAVSPDGKQIAFARGHSQRQGESTISAITSRQLWLIGASGDPRQLTNASGWADEAPLWTPDGAWLLFVRWRPSGPAGAATAGLWAVRPDGGQPVQLLLSLGSTNGFSNGFGYYGMFGWQQQVAIASTAP